MSEHLSIPVAEKQENGHPEVEEHKAGASTITESPSVTPVKKFGTESDSKLRRSYTERQHENVDALINCVTKNIGFTRGKPIAAISIYKCLLHWKSFEAERTSVFDRLIQMIGSAIEGFLSSPSSASLAAPVMEVVRKVEAKYPALLFKQQLTAYVEKIYGIIRDNLKKELSSFLHYVSRYNEIQLSIVQLNCFADFIPDMQAPRTSKGVARTGRSFAKDSPTDHWQSIIESLNTLLCTLKENFVPPVLTQKIFTQTFSYINVQLFNSNGEYVKAGLAELELWCCQAKEEYAGPSWDELKHIRQAVGFLVIHQKYRISYDEITNDLCPILSVQQLYRICTLYWDGNYNTRSVSPYVISSMKMLMAEDSNDALSDSFLLDDNSSIPFSVDDLTSSLQEKDFSDVKPAEGHQRLAESYWAEPKNTRGCSGIKEEVVLSPAHALSLIATGEEHRHVGSNNFNLVSSRCHTIFTLTIESSSHGEDTGEEDVILSHLHLIDLAGSESSKTETTGLRRKEGSYINKSLLTLGTLICTVTPASSSSEETHNTLKFASRSKHVEIKAAQNKIMDEKSLIKKYQREIHDLKQELQQLKHGIMENPNVAVSSQEDLVNLKLQLEAGRSILQSRLEEEEQAKAALMGRIQRLTKLILVQYLLIALLAVERHIPCMGSKSHLTPGREFLLRVSFLEIYNEVINDLLNPTGQNLRIREDAQLAYMPDRKRDHLIDDDSGSHASELSVEGKDDVTNLDELMKDYKWNKRRGMLGWFKMREFCLQVLFECVSKDRPALLQVYLSLYTTIGSMVDQVTNGTIVCGDSLALSGFKVSFSYLAFLFNCRLKFILLC
ncbi:myosin-6-like isoform X2 [Senna tora]|uniref:Kinesin-like protein n=1 Tax=Senna tora TaxID=362788 RepID=A0A834X3A4_9FABA|nr:myosin-6-like isoform X2 [Senna tora]